MNISRESLGSMEDGRDIALWKLATGGKARISSIELMDFGASIRSVRWGGREIVLGFDTLAGYRNQTAFTGASCGRFANRIFNAGFELDGKRYSLPANDGPNTLHGGKENFAYLPWDSLDISDSDAGYCGVRFTLHSPDGDQGFPGNLAVSVEYILTDADELLMYYRAETDAPTPVNLTNHAYWNLAGEGSGEIYDHRIILPGRRYVEVDRLGIPLGVLSDVDCGTGLMDLQREVRIGDRIADRHYPGGLSAPAALSGGYDHCYQVNADAPVLLSLAGGGRLGEILERKTPRLAATVSLAEGGNERAMEIYTSFPGIQFYSGNSLNGLVGRGGKAFTRHSALCLETQYFPDSPNNSEFPNCILRPGEVFEELTVHRFCEN